MLPKSKLAIWKPQFGSLRLKLKREVTRTPKFSYSTIQDIPKSVSHEHSSQACSSVSNTIACFLNRT